MRLPKFRFVGLPIRFTYTVADGSNTAKAGTVYLVSPQGMLASAEFDTGAGSWQVFPLSPFVDMRAVRYTPPTLCFEWHDLPYIIDSSIRSV